MRIHAAALALLLLAPAEAAAEWQLKPFLGISFDRGTTFVDVDQSISHNKVVFGVDAVVLGDIFGVEADLGYGPSFFQTSSLYVQNSSATTFTGNVIIGIPRHMVKYTLRPYAVGGAGLMHIRIDDLAGAFPIASTLPAIDVGGGVTGFLTDHVGLSWELRWFNSIRGKDEGSGISFGPQHLSFWRANMALAIR